MTSAFLGLTKGSTIKEKQTLTRRFSLKNKAQSYLYKWFLKGPSSKTWKTSKQNRVVNRNRLRGVGATLIYV